MILSKCDRTHDLFGIFIGCLIPSTEKTFCQSKCTIAGRNKSPPIDRMTSEIESHWRPVSLLGATLASPMAILSASSSLIFKIIVISDPNVGKTCLIYSLLLPRSHAMNF